MRANITLKMDRAIDPHRHYISPGGYEVIVEGKNYQFDFMESCALFPVMIKPSLRFV